MFDPRMVRYQNVLPALYVHGRELMTPNRYLRYRYTLDRVIAAIALIVASPILAALSAIVWVFDGRPVLIALHRMGQGGKIFKMHKVRTMRKSGDSDPSGLRVTLRDDPRVTRLGRVLRHSRFDEWPQLVDVVRGRMALIGPRPEEPSFVDLTNPEWTKVLCLRPGIAGWSQLLLHRWEAEQLSHSDLAESQYMSKILPAKLGCDSWYADNAGVRIDCRILRGLWRDFVLDRPVSATEVPESLLSGTRSS